MVDSELTSGVTHECGTAQVLDGPGEGGALRSAQINALEAIPVLCASGEGLLVLVGKMHLRDFVLNVLWVRGFLL